jgi:xanthine dehydrogenase YagT iron-sulfur-binding subunit
VEVRELVMNDTSVATTRDVRNLETVAFRINGTDRPLDIDIRSTLLDVLRENLQLTGTKKGCDQGTCGACTVIIDGQRVLACLTLAATCAGQDVRTIEGLASPGSLTALQEAFLECDAYQCGFCTPGQIMSATALLDEVRAGVPSHVTPNVREQVTSESLSAEEIRERMSGNLCRCGAYPNIVAAVQSVLAGENRR